MRESWSPDSVVQLRQLFEGLQDVVRDQVEMVVFGGELPRADVSEMRWLAGELRNKAEAMNGHADDAKKLLDQQDSVGVFGDHLRDTLHKQHESAVGLGDRTRILADRTDGSANEAEKTLCVMYVFGLELCWRIIRLIAISAAAGPGGTLSAVPAVESILAKGRIEVQAMRVGLERAFERSAAEATAKISALGPLQLVGTVGKAAALPLAVDAGTQLLQVEAGYRDPTLIGENGENPRGIDTTSILAAGVSGAGGAAGGVLAGSVATRAFPRIQNSRLLLGLVHGSAGGAAGLGSAALVTGWPERSSDALAAILNGAFGGAVSTRGGVESPAGRPPGAVVDGVGAFTPPDAAGTARHTAPRVEQVRSGIEPSTHAESVTTTTLAPRDGIAAAPGDNVFGAASTERQPVATDPGTAAKEPPGGVGEPAPSQPTAEARGHMSAGANDQVPVSTERSTSPGAPEQSQQPMAPKTDGTIVGESARLPDEFAGYPAPSTRADEQQHTTATMEPQDGTPSQAESTASDQLAGRRSGPHPGIGPDGAAFELPAVATGENPTRAAEQSMDRRVADPHRAAHSAGVGPDQVARPTATAMPGNEQAGARSTEKTAGRPPWVTADPPPGTSSNAAGGQRPERISAPHRTDAPPTPQDRQAEHKPDPATRNVDSLTSEQPGATDQPGASDRPTTSDRLGASDQLDTSDHPDTPERAERSTEVHRLETELVELPSADPQVKADLTPQQNEQFTAAAKEAQSLYRSRREELAAESWEQRRQVMERGDEVESLLRSIDAMREGTGKTPRWNQLEAFLLGAHGFMRHMGTGQGKSMVGALDALRQLSRGEPAELTSGRSMRVHHVLTTTETLANDGVRQSESMLRSLGYDVSRWDPNNPPPEPERPTVYYLTYDERATAELHDRPPPGKTATIDEADAVLVHNQTVHHLSDGQRELASDVARTEVYRVRDFLRQTLFDRALTSADLRTAAEASLAEANRLWERKTGRAFTAEETEMARAFLDVKAGRLKLNRDFQVFDGKIQILDEYGKPRSDPKTETDSRWFGGRHKMVEATFGVDVYSDGTGSKQVTVEDVLGGYERLQLMSGTLENTAAEIKENFPVEGGLAKIEDFGTSKLEAEQDRIFLTEPDKLKDAVTRVQQLQEQGRPVLVICPFNDVAQKFSLMLGKAGVEHHAIDAQWFAGHRNNNLAEGQLLGVKDHAGERGAVTVGTGMLGRGFDVTISDEVNELGGVHAHMLGRSSTNPDEDHQWASRAGRNGRNGSYSFDIAANDPLYRETQHHGAKVAITHYRTAVAEHAEATANAAKTPIEQAFTADPWQPYPDGAENRAAQAEVAATEADVAAAEREMRSLTSSVQQDAADRAYQDRVLRRANQANTPSPVSDGTDTPRHPWARANSTGVDTLRPHLPDDRFARLAAWLGVPESAATEAAVAFNDGSDEPLSPLLNRAGISPAAVQALNQHLEHAAPASVGKAVHLDDEQALAQLMPQRDQLANQLGLAPEQVAGAEGLREVGRAAAAARDELALVVDSPTAEVSAGTARGVLADAVTHELVFDTETTPTDNTAGAAPVLAASRYLATQTLLDLVLGIHQRSPKSCVNNGVTMMRVLHPDNEQYYEMPAEMPLQGHVLETTQWAFGGTFDKFDSLDEAAQSLSTRPGGRQALVYNWMNEGQVDSHLVLLANDSDQRDAPNLVVLDIATAGVGAKDLASRRALLDKGVSFARWRNTQQRLIEELDKPRRGVRAIEFDRRGTALEPYSRTGQPVTTETHSTDTSALPPGGRAAAASSVPGNAWQSGKKPMSWSPQGNTGSTTVQQLVLTGSRPPDPDPTERHEEARPRAESVDSTRAVPGHVDRAQKERVAESAHPVHDRGPTADVTPGAWIKEYRLDRRVTQKQIAHTAGLTKEAISKIENGKSKPRVASFQQICRALEVPSQVMAEVTRRFYPDIGVAADSTADVAPGAWIKTQRLDRGMKQEQLAQVAELTGAAVSNIENGNRQPKFGTFRQLCRALEVPSEVLTEALRKFYPDIASGREPTAHERLSGWVSALRNETGTTRQDLARAVGVSTTRISEIENDLQRLQPGVLRRIARALEVPEKDLARAIRHFYPDLDSDPTAYRSGAPGSWIAALRNDRALSKAALGRGAGTSTGYVSKVEDETHRPSLEVFRRICGALGVSHETVSKATQYFYPDLDLPLDPTAHNFLGRWIVALRRDRGISRTELTADIGPGWGNLSGIENGQYTPRLAVFRRICNALGVGPEVLRGATRHFYPHIDLALEPAAHRNLGGWIAALRNEQDISRRALAHATGLSDRSLLLIETKDHDPLFSTFRRICTGLGVRGGMLIRAIRDFYPEDGAHLDPAAHETLGHWIAAMRHDWGVAQDELGRKSGVARRTISDIENNRYLPRLRKLRQLCQALEVGGELLLEVVERFYADRYERSGYRDEEALFQRYVTARVGSAEERKIENQIVERFAWVPKAVACRDVMGRRESADIRDDVLQVAWMATQVAIRSHTPSASFAAHAWASCRGAVYRLRLELRFPDLDNRTRKMVSTVSAQIDRMVVAGVALDNTKIARLLKLEVADVVVAREMLDRPVLRMDAPIEREPGSIHRDLADRSPAGFSDAEFAMTVRAALADLPDPDTAQRLVMLHLVEGMSLTDAAGRVGLPPATAPDVLAEVITRLRSAFDPHDDIEEAAGQHNLSSATPWNIAEVTPSETTKNTPSDTTKTTQNQLSTQPNPWASSRNTESTADGPSGFIGSRPTDPSDPMQSRPHRSGFTPGERTAAAKSTNAGAETDRPLTPHEAEAATPWSHPPDHDGAEGAPPSGRRLVEPEEPKEAPGEALAGDPVASPAHIDGGDEDRDLPQYIGSRPPDDGDAPTEPASALGSRNGREDGSADLIGLVDSRSGLPTYTPPTMEVRNRAWQVLRQYWGAAAAPADLMYRWRGQLSSKQTVQAAQKCAAHAAANTRIVSRLAPEELRALVLVWPEYLGKAGGFPRRARDQANRLAFAQAKADLERTSVDGLSKRDELLRESLRNAEDLLIRAEQRAATVDTPEVPTPSVMLEWFDAEDPRVGATVSFGSADPVAEAWHIDGSDGSLRRLDSRMQLACNHYEIAAREKPDRPVRIVVWSGTDGHRLAADMTALYALGVTGARTGPETQPERQLIVYGKGGRPVRKVLAYESIARIMDAVVVCGESNIEKTGDTLWKIAPTTDTYYGIAARRNSAAASTQFPGRQFACRFPRANEGNLDAWFKSTRDTVQRFEKEPFDIRKTIDDEFLSYVDDRIKAPTESLENMGRILAGRPEQLTFPAGSNDEPVEFSDYTRQHVGWRLDADDEGILPRDPISGVPILAATREDRVSARRAIVSRGGPDRSSRDLLHRGLPDDFTRAGRLATENERWWNSLPAEEKRAVVAVYPEEVGNAPGFPSEVAEYANDYRRHTTVFELLDRGRENASRSERHAFRNLYAVEEALARSVTVHRGIPQPVVSTTSLDPDAFGGNGSGTFVIGDCRIEDAEHVVWYVDGVNTRLQSSPVRLAHARNLYEELMRVDPSTKVAVVCWIGYEAPANNKEPWSSRPELAEAGGRLFARDVLALRAVSSAKLSVLGYSYGTPVVAEACVGGRLSGVFFNGVTVGSPGRGLRFDSATDTSCRNSWVLAQSDDMVAGFGGSSPGMRGRALGEGPLGLGTDPATDPNVTRVHAERGFPHALAPFDGHGEYLNYALESTSQPTEALRHAALCLAGRGEEVPTEMHRPILDEPTWQQRLYVPVNDPASGRRASPLGSPLTRHGGPESPQDLQRPVAEGAYDPAASQLDPGGPDSVVGGTAENERPRIALALGATGPWHAEWAVNEALAQGADTLVMQVGRASADLDVLDQACRAIPDGQVSLAVDMNIGPGWSDGEIRAKVAEVVALLDGHAMQWQLRGIDHRVLRQAAELAPHCRRVAVINSLTVATRGLRGPVGWVVRSVRPGNNDTAAILEEAKQAGATAVAVNTRLLSNDFVQCAADAGIDVVGWGADNSRRMRASIGMGIEEIATANPALLRAEIAESGFQVLEPSARPEPSPKPGSTPWSRRTDQ